MALARLYPALHYPGTAFRGGAVGDWAPQGAIHWSWGPDHSQSELSPTKTNAGTQSQFNIATNQQGDYDLLYWRYLTTPRDAGTVSGTLTLCFMLHARWITASTNTADSVVRTKVHAYISVGSTTAVRHVLIDNAVDSNDWPSGAAASWVELALALTEGEMLAGDRVIVEFGARIVSSPTPTPTVPPTDWSRIPVRIHGTNLANGTAHADAVHGDTSTSRAPWLEFSELPAAQALPSAPANDACADAIVIASLPYQSDFINTANSQDTNKAAWWTFTPAENVQVLLHALGSNYPVEFDAFTAGCGTLTPVTVLNGLEGEDVQYNNPRCTSYMLLDLVGGTQYHFRARHFPTAASFNGPDHGGALRVGMIETAQTPVIDDLYLPCGYVFAFREGEMVGFTPTFFDFHPTGVGIDYSQRPMDDGNDPGGTPHTGYRLLVGLHEFDLVEILDLTTMNLTGVEVDFISTWLGAGTAHPAQLHVTATGIMHAAHFGDGYLFVNGDGALPAFMNTPSSVDAMDDWWELDILDANNQATPQASLVTRDPGADETVPWAISLDEDQGWMYYTSSSLYITTDAATAEIRRWHLESGAEEVWATVDLVTGNMRGLKGLQAIPGGGGVFVCNGPVVQQYDGSGALVQTFDGFSVPLDHQSNVDVKISADGLSIYVADLATTRITKFEIATGLEEDTWQPYGLHGTLLQMAIFQPEGFTPPSPTECVVDVPSVQAWSDGQPSVSCIGAQPTRPESASFWASAVEDVVDTDETTGYWSTYWPGRYWTASYWPKSHDEETTIAGADGCSVDAMRVGLWRAH